jgi:LmbE family N-acetylglucosaminyl deacetylase
MDLSDKSILAVLAHPDDETFGMGGTLALYARRGASVHLLCATRGEVGTVDPQHLRGFNSIAERRETELCCAVEKLGLDGVYFLNYRDSGMPGSPDNHHPEALAAADLDSVVARIVPYIRSIRPQVVITFDPIGGYKHPDHIAIHKATVKAFWLAGDPEYKDGQAPYQPIKLYYQTIPKGFLRLAVSIMTLLKKDPRHFGRNGDIDLATLVEEGNFPTHARINYREVSEIKNEATLCHTSQLDGPSLRRGPMRWFQTIAGEKEYFMRAVPPATPGLRERDLFAGL